MDKRYHSPAPFKLDHADGYYILDAKGGGVVDQMTDCEQVEANCSLFIAAPKMLDALKNLIDRGIINEDSGDCYDECIEAIEEAEWLPKESTVGELDDSAYTFVQSEDEVQQIRENIGSKDENFRYYIVKIEEGEYLEVWGCDSPALDDTAIRVK